MDYQDTNLFAVDTTNVQEMGGFEVYPAGLYPAVMITASKKDAKNQQNKFIECVYQFFDGEYVGKKYTSRINLWNINQIAVDIAKREVKSLRKVLGLSDQESDISSFLNKPLVLNLGVDYRKEAGVVTDKLQNQLLSIEPFENEGHGGGVSGGPLNAPAVVVAPRVVAAHSQTAPVPIAAAAAPIATGKKPWDRR